MHDDMYEAKKRFVEALAAFYINETGNALGIKSMSYCCDFWRDEWIDVYFGIGSVKRICVTGDSHHGIFKDFARFVLDFDRYHWLVEEG